MKKLLFLFLTTLWLSGCSYLIHQTPGSVVGVPPNDNETVPSFSVSITQSDPYNNSGGTLSVIISAKNAGSESVCQISGNVKAKFNGQVLESVHVLLENGEALVSNDTYVATANFSNTTMQDIDSIDISGITYNRVLNQ